MRSCVVFVGANAAVLTFSGAGVRARLHTKHISLLEGEYCVLVMFLFSSCTSHFPATAVVVRMDDATTMEIIALLAVQ